MTFAQRGIGDVLLAWENEAFLALKEFGKDQFEIVSPSLSILAEPPVSVVDGNVDAKGTRKVAEAYLQFLYTPAAQAIIAKNYYRPRAPEFAAKEDLERFPKLELITVDKVFGGWKKAQPTHFADGGVFDQIQKADPLAMAVQHSPRWKRERAARLRAHARLDAWSIFRSIVLFPLGALIMRASALGVDRDLEHRHRAARARGVRTTFGISSPPR